MNSGLIKRSRIMIVDDEPANLKLVDLLLERHGYEQRVLVQDPREVLEQYKAVPPDLILLDLNMPHLDGYQVMEQLKALEDPLLPPVVVLTAQNSRDYLLRALTAGARDFVGKPFDTNELLMRVRNLLDAQMASRLIYNQREVLEELVRIRTAELHHTRLQAVRRLGMAAEYRDEETGSHILRMSRTCELLARADGWDDA